ncbi:hypothetical protein NP233_g1417 [Leucocoprinus birnbaumii]|uniref:Uncharacterized protein n=1 Tax=Leucocoprinus birnbaumii TaxID=56174 RepID=A0AAD5W5M1_9AGAR|nr:hypothetical protein NP233_g1417 [Leucocoprinus birnbaumii]
MKKDNNFKGRDNGSKSPTAVCRQIKPNCGVSYTNYSKKAQLEVSSVSDDPLSHDSTNPNSNYPFTELPLDVLAETLVSTSSPRDLLAVVRTQRTAYAAFVFDDGICEYCGAETNNTYMSYALRLRFCVRRILYHIDSHGSILEGTAFSYRHLIWYATPKLENSSFFERYLPRYEIASRYLSIKILADRLNLKEEDPDLIILRPDQDVPTRYLLAKELRVNPLSVTSYRSLRFASMKKNTWHEFCCDLAIWQKHRLAYLEELKKTMSQLSRHLAREEKWKHTELINLASYGQFVEQVLLEGQITGGTSAKLSVQAACSPESPLTVMLKQQISHWIERAKYDLLTTIDPTGALSKEWKNRAPTSKAPHPVLGTRALWRCKACNTVEQRYAVDECLDFSGVCTHQCKEEDGKKQVRGKPSGSWSVDNFVACAAAESCRRIISEDKTSPWSTIFTASRACTSCSPRIPLNGGSILGHSHRHPEGMNIERFDPFGNSALPITQFGLAQWLSVNSRGVAKRWIEMKKFICCRCFYYQHPKQAEQGTSTSAVEMNQETATKKFEERLAGMNRFDFNGLRSHLASKHKIHAIRDEDFHCEKNVEDYPELVTVTVDDAGVDPTTGNPISYSASDAANTGWKAQPGCTFCTAQLDVGKVFDGTWHDGSDGATAQFTFTGVAVLVSGVIGSGGGEDISDTRIDFFVDNSFISTYTSPNTTGQPRSFNYNNSSPTAAFLLDSITYTFNNDTQSTSPSPSTSASSGTATTSPATATSSSAHSTLSQGGIIGIAVGVGLSALLALVGLAFWWRRRRHGQNSWPSRGPIDPDYLSPGVSHSDPSHMQSVSPLMGGVIGHQNNASYSYSPYNHLSEASQSVSSSQQASQGMPSGSESHLTVAPFTVSNSVSNYHHPSKASRPSYSSTPQSAPANSADIEIQSATDLSNPTIASSANSDAVSDHPPPPPYDPDNQASSSRFLSVPLKGRQKIPTPQIPTVRNEP